MCFTFKKNNKQTKKPVNCFLQDDANAGIQSLHPMHGTLGFITIYQSINVKCFELPQCFTCMMILSFYAILRVFVLCSHCGYSVSSKQLNAHQALESMNL